MSKDKVIVANNTGVYSSVIAALLKDEVYEVIAITIMKKYKIDSGGNK